MRRTPKQEAAAAKQQLKELKEQAKAREIAIREQAKIQIQEAVKKEQAKVQKKVARASKKIKNELKEELKKELNNKLKIEKKKKTWRKGGPGRPPKSASQNSNLSKGVISKNIAMPQYDKEILSQNSTAKILLVDDKPKVLSESLPLFGYDVDVAQNGIEALHFLSNTEVKYDLVLLDLMMPHMNGWETLKAIRNNKRLEDMPVIMITAANEEQQQVFGLKYGADDYIVKPFLLPNLLARIEALLRRAHWQKNKNTNIDLSNIQEGILTLTKKEKVILHMLANGLGNKEMAEKARLKEVTIKTHLNNIFKKLKVTTRTQAVLIAIQLQNI